MTSNQAVGTIKQQNIIVYKWNAHQNKVRLYLCSLVTICTLCSAQYRILNVYMCFSVFNNTYLTMSCSNYHTFEQSVPVMTPHFNRFYQCNNLIDRENRGTHFWNEKYSFICDKLVFLDDCLSPANHLSFMTPLPPSLIYVSWDRERELTLKQSIC